MKRRSKPKPEPKATLQLSLLENTTLAVDLFATMLQSVELARQRVQREKEVGSNGSANAKPTPRCA